MRETKYIKREVKYIKGEKVKDGAICENHGKWIFINSKAKCREDAVEGRHAVQIVSGRG